LPGASAHDILRSGSAIPAAALGRAVTAVRSVRANGVREHRLADELAVIRKFADRTEVVDSKLADEMRAAEEAFGRRSGAGTADAGPDGAAPLVFAHRDLHDKQILCDGPNVGLIDWDLAALAPTALDPGNFLAHLTLRRLQGRILDKRAETTREAFLAGPDGTTVAGGPDASGPEMRNLHDWVSVALLRLVGVYALRPGWPGLSRRLLAAFHHSLETA
ncbi:MAG TPA: phosphotransferase, partial [bacterium]|nr:phosphotransferase [bacterium]